MLILKIIRFSFNRPMGQGDGSVTHFCAKIGIKLQNCKKMREKLQKYLEQSLSHGARHGVTSGTIFVWID